MNTLVKNEVYKKKTKKKPFFQVSSQNHNNEFIVFFPKAELRMTSYGLVTKIPVVLANNLLRLLPMVHPSVIINDLFRRDATFADYL